MKNTLNLVDGFDKLDTSINKWLVANSITILRFAMGIIFLGFGILKFFYRHKPD